MLRAGALALRGPSALIEPVNELLNCSVGRIPLLAKEGWLRHQ